jgi:hypothetical protein
LAGGLGGGAVGRQRESALPCPGLLETMNETNGEGLADGSVARDPARHASRAHRTVRPA